MISKNHITVPGYRSVVRSTTGKKEIDNKYINYSHRLRDLLSMYSQRIKKKEYMHIIYWWKWRELVSKVLGDKHKIYQWIREKRGGVGGL